MIGKLTGRLDAVSDNGAIIDVGGVGYSVFTSSRTMSQLGSIGEVVTVLDETHVREDHIHLYAFYSDDEKRWFQTLQTVQGVGSKAALAILSALTSEDIMISVSRGVLTPSTTSRVSPCLKVVSVLELPLLR